MLTLFKVFISNDVIKLVTDV